MKGVNGKVAIVTGGGGGIGSVTCQRFADEGAKIAVFDINGEAADATAKTISDNGATARAYAVDLTDYDAVKTAVADVERDLGPIGILVNNAGWDIFMPFLKTEPAHWEKLIAINLKGALNMLHSVLPYMVEREQGRVVTVSSDSGRVGSSGEAVYSACKAGLIALTKTLAREHSRHAITFNVVCPGLTDTAMFDAFLEGAKDPDKLREAFRRAIPIGRIGNPEDLPGAICFLSSDDAGYITGQVLSVSGGLTMNG